MAAFGGALKEPAEAAGQTIGAQILDHSQFEHLESKGMVSVGGKVRQAVAAVQQLAR